MLQYSKTIFSSLLLAILLLPGFSQNRVNSPYSRYGVGDIERKGTGTSRALGGLSTSLRVDNQVNYDNPASYTTQDSMSFIFDVGLIGNYVQSLSVPNDLSTEAGNANFHHLAIGFPVASWWKSSLGVVPYSTVNYRIEDMQPLGGNQVNYLYQGTGGLSKFYIGNAIELFDQLSIGFNFCYLFGYIENIRQTTFTDRNFQDTRVEETNILGDIMFNYGLQYYQDITDDFGFTIGVIFDNETKISSEQDKTVVNYISQDDQAKYDTLFSSPEEEDIKKILIPQRLGGGLSFHVKEKFIFGVDYSQQDWSQASFKNVNNNLGLQRQVNAGIQFTPDKYSIRNYTDRFSYRLGGYYNETYLQLSGQQVVDRGISLGLGLPFRNSKTSVNFAVELGRRGLPDMVQEDYLNFMVNLSLYDFWFFKRRFE